MNKDNETSKEKKFNRFLYLFVFLYYILIWGSFGLKFAYAVAISSITGLIIKFFSNKEKAFAWQLFLLYPMFYSLSLSLWIIPLILTLAYLISCGAFGGYEKRYFCPVIIAVVISICGYGYTASLNASRPMLFGKAFNVYTSGIPAFKPIWKIYPTIEVNESFKASFNGKIPSVLGASRGGILLLASLVFSIMFKRKRVWLFSSIIFIMVFTALFSKMPLIKCYYPLLFGTFPLLLLTSLSDDISLPQKTFEQIIASFLFSLFLVLFTFRTDSPFLPVYSYLIMQILTPLLLDFFALFSKQGVLNEKK